MKGRSRILIFTGDGKGKTTAALGMVLRASGHSLRTLILQFIKANALTGELSALRRLAEVEVVQTGCGFTPPPDHAAFSEHRRAAQDGLRRAEEAVRSNRYDMIILDEVCTAITKGLVTEDQVMDVVNQADEGTCLVLTGRGATDRLISKADTVTEMRCLKHGLHEGWKAQRGVEY
jgi:cob(I)alamin adenosyltransferase